MDNEKAERVKLEKMALLEQRKQIQATMHAEKEELMRKFEQIQKTGKIPPELADRIGKDKLDSLNNTLEKSPNPNATTDSHSKKPTPVKKPKQQVTAQPKALPKTTPDNTIKKEAKNDAFIKQNEK